MKRAQLPAADLTAYSLARIVARELDWTADDGALAVQKVLDVVGRALAEGRRVKLTNFGTLEPVDRNLGAGSLGGKIAETVAVHTVRFRLSGRLLRAVREGQPVDTLKKSPKSY